MKEMERLKEENKQLLQTCDKEIATREDAEQKLANAKSDLAKAKSEIEDKFYLVVSTCMCIQLFRHYSNLWYIFQHQFV